METPDIVAWLGSVSLVLIGWILTARAILHAGQRVSTLSERIAHLEGKLEIPLESRGEAGSPPAQWPKPPGHVET